MAIPTRVKPSLTKGSHLQGPSRLNRQYSRRPTLPFHNMLSRDVETITRSPIDRPLHRNIFSAEQQDSVSLRLKENKDICLWLQKMRNIEKIEEIFDYSLSYYLSRLNEQSSDSRELNWEKLREAVQPLSLPPLEAENTYDLLVKMLKIFPKHLLIGEKKLEQYKPKDFLLSPTDYYWALAAPSIPFTRRVEELDFNPAKIQYILDQFKKISSDSNPLQAHKKEDQELMDLTLFSIEEDALAAFLLAFPYLKETSVVHDIGCWNGQNLLHLLYYSHLRNQRIGGALGTDINLPVLNAAEIASRMLGLTSPHVHFHRAHVLSPLDLKKAVSFPNENVVRLALRVIPVLDRFSAQAFLQLTHQFLKDHSSVCILSYALPKGTTFEKNLEKSNDSKSNYTKDVFEEGITFKLPFPFPSALPDHLQGQDENRMIANSYYSREGFRKLIHKADLKIRHSIVVGEHSDNYREVVALANKI